jgi:hypothetical protein
VAQSVYRPTVDDVREIALSLDPGFNRVVSRWEIEVGEDWLGEPGIFVKIVLRDSDLHAIWKSRIAFRNSLRRRLLDLYPDYFPFITFSAESIAINPEQPATA